MGILATIVSCDSIDDLLTFTISDQVNLQIKSSSPLSLPFEILTPEIATNSTQEFQNNNTRADLVKDVKLQELKLVITAPGSKTFSFLKSIHIYISADGYNEIELASLDNVTSNVNSITLSPTLEKLDNYAKASSY